MRRKGTLTTAMPSGAPLFTVESYGNRTEHIFDTYARRSYTIFRYYKTRQPHYQFTFHSKSTNINNPKMVAFLALTVLVQTVFGGNLVDVLQHDGETTLISLVKQAGLADALLAGKLNFYRKMFFQHYFCDKQVFLRFWR